MTPSDRINGLIAKAPANRAARAGLAAQTISAGGWRAHEGDIDNLLACGNEDCCSGGLEDALCNEDCPDCVEFACLFHVNGNELQTYLDPL